MDQNKVVNPIQVQKFLKGIDYPADKKTLVSTAKKEGADNNVVSTLDKLPEMNYNSPNDVTQQIGKLT